MLSWLGRLCRWAGREGDGDREMENGEREMEIGRGRGKEAFVK